MSWVLTTILLALFLRLVQGNDTIDPSRRHILVAASPLLDHVEPLFRLAQRASTVANCTVDFYFSSHFEWLLVKSSDRILLQSNSSSIYASTLFPNLQLVSISTHPYHGKSMIAGPILAVDDIHEHLHFWHDSLFQPAVGMLYHQYSRNIRYDVAVCA